MIYSLNKVNSGGGLIVDVERVFGCVCCVYREKWYAFCPVKPACTFYVATALLARSDTQVYLARRRLAASIPHGSIRPVRFQPTRARELIENYF